MSYVCTSGSGSSYIYIYIYIISIIKLFETFYYTRPNKARHSFVYNSIFFLFDNVLVSPEFWVQKNNPNKKRNSFMIDKHLKTTTHLKQ